jgi:hypothetical protein
MVEVRRKEIWALAVVLVLGLAVGLLAVLLVQAIHL